MYQPIPLDFLHVAALDEANGATRPATAYSSVSAQGYALQYAHVPHEPRVLVKLRVKIKGGFPLVFAQLGRRGYQVILWADTLLSQRKWVQHVEDQQTLLRRRRGSFKMKSLSEGFFVGTNMVNCATRFGGSF